MANITYINGGRYTDATTNTRNVKAFLLEQRVDALLTGQTLTVDGVRTTFAGAADIATHDGQSVVIAAKTNANVGVTVNYMRGGSFQDPTVDVATVGEFLRDQGVRTLAQGETLHVDGNVYPSIEAAADVTLHAEISIVIKAKTAANK